MSLNSSFLASASASFDANSRYTLAMNAMTSQDPNHVLQKRQHSQEHHQHTYNVKVSNEFKITSQKSSGRCWIFACLNVMRNQMVKKYSLPDTFELSQTFCFFYDKLERCNYFLDQIIQTVSEPLDERLVQHLLSSPMNDGGQWEMLVNVVEKYGVVPKAVYGEAWSSTASVRFNRFMTSLLRDWACKIRAAQSAGSSLTSLTEMKEAFLVEAHRVLTIHFGKPPTSFTFEFNDKDKKLHRFEACTPMSFLNEHVPYVVGDQVSLINDPRNPYYKAYTVQSLGNVVGGKPVFYINVPIGELKKYTLETLKDDVPVWFGCDVGKHFNRARQTMDSEQFDYDLVFGTKPTQSKADRLRYGQSLMTHAMVFTGADVAPDATVPRRWRVENSWGDDTGDKGFALLTDAWFDEYMYQVVVDKSRFAADEQLMKCLDMEPIVLPAWDPMGALA